MKIAFSIIILTLIIGVIIYTFFFPDTKKEEEETEEWDDELISDPKTGKYLTFEQVEKGQVIDSPENKQYSRDLINKPDEVLDIIDYLNDNYQETQNIGQQFETITREFGAKKQYINILLDKLYQINNFGFVGLIEIEYMYFEGRRYTSSSEYQLGIFIVSKLNPNDSQKIVIEHFRESFKRGSVLTLNGITLLKLDVHAELSDLLRIVNKIKTLANTNLSLPSSKLKSKMN